MLIKILAVLIFSSCLTLELKSQDSKNQNIYYRKYGYNLLENKFSADTNIKLTGKSKVQTVNIGGLFLAPFIGVAFPFGTFKNYSKSGIVYGAKFELAYSRLYPFIFGFVYELQKNKGNADFTTVNFLTTFDTKITSIGGSLDILLNKFIKSNFTTPILSIEIKYAKVTRVIVPDISFPGIVSNESFLSYAAGLGVTIYVFDLSGRYTYAKNYNNLAFQLKLHIPVIRF